MVISYFERVDQISIARDDSLEDYHINIVSV